MRSCWLIFIMFGLVAGCTHSPQYNKIQGMMLEPARTAEAAGDYERAFRKPRRTWPKTR